jgi:hypothetical protein
MQNLLVGYIEFKDACVHDKNLCDMFKRNGKVGESYDRWANRLCASCPWIGYMYMMIPTL